MTMTVSDLWVDVLGEVAYAFCTFHFEGKVKGQSQPRIVNGRNTFIREDRKRIVNYAQWHSKEAWQDSF